MLLVAHAWRLVVSRAQRIPYIHTHEPRVYHTLKCAHTREKNIIKQQQHHSIEACMLLFHAFQFCFHTFLTCHLNDNDSDWTCEWAKETHVCYTWTRDIHTYSLQMKTFQRTLCLHYFARQLNGFLVRCFLPFIRSIELFNTFLLSLLVWFKQFSLKQNFVLLLNQSDDLFFEELTENFTSFFRFYWVIVKNTFFNSKVLNW